MSGDHDRYKWVDSKEELDKVRESYTYSRDDEGNSSLDSVSDIRLTLLESRIAKLEEYDEFVNLTTPKPDSDEGDAFVRQELLSMYDCCDGRDATALEYVIRLVSTPAQWEEFYRVNDLKHVFAIGE